MPIEFQITNHIVGISMNHAAPGEMVHFRVRELLGPNDAALPMRLDQFHGPLFAKIPELPPPSLIDNLVVVIRPDLACTAYVNELELAAGATPGSPAYAVDFAELLAANAATSKLASGIPADAAVVVLRSRGWRRSLYFDLLPLSGKDREVSLEVALAQQTRRLLGAESDVASAATRAPPTNAPRDARVFAWEAQLTRLRDLLTSQCTEERVYQEFLNENPWVFRSRFSAIGRHTRLDDRFIPDFLATRNVDGFLDLLEIKQPFLSLFVRSGGFSAEFHNALAQLEGYLDLAVEQPSYLRGRGLQFEHPEGLLLIGYGLTEEQARQIRKTAYRRSHVRVMTYDALLSEAERVIRLTREGWEPVPAVTIEQKV